MTVSFGVLSQNKYLILRNKEGSNCSLKAPIYTLSKNLQNCTFGLFGNRCLVRALAFDRVVSPRYKASSSFKPKYDCPESL